MEQDEVRQVILRELPALVKRDPQIREWVQSLIRQYSLPRAEAESRFDRTLAEIRAMREESERKWEEQKRRWEKNQQELRAMREESERRWQEQARKWEEQERKWEAQERRWQENQQELRAMREESERRWQEQARKWEEQERRWEKNQRELRAMREESERRWQEQARKWEEQNQKWKENQKQIWALIEEIRRVDHRIDRTIGALGARWGLSSEASFRKGLAAILEKSFHVTVERVNFWDEAGEVFGRPDQVELDVIIRNGEVLACELKSSASRSDVYAFERKVRAYAKRTGREVKRMILISPMVEPKAQKVAQELGIEVYSDAEDVIP